MVLVAAQLRDEQLVLQFAPRAIRVLHWNGDRPQLGGVINLVAWAVAQTEPSDAAVLQGAARRLMLGELTTGNESTPPVSRANGAPSVIGDVRRDTTRHLVESLGDASLRDGRAAGEALDLDQAVAVALDLINRVTASDAG
jgi:hypothetical protein